MTEINSNSIQFPPPTPGLEFLTRVEVELGPVSEIGQTGFGFRRVIPITGGNFEGPRFSGRVLHGGADWQLVQNSGVAHVDARYTLETSDGALVYITAQGLRHGPAEVMAELAAGQIVDPTKYYFRTVIRFETSVPAYNWLNKILAIGAGMRLASTVIYDAYMVK